MSVPTYITESIVYDAKLRNNFPNFKQDVDRAIALAWDTGNSEFRQLLSNWVDNGRKINFRYAVDQFGAFLNSGEIRVDPSLGYFTPGSTDQVQIFDKYGESFGATIERTIVHELIHALSSKDDGVTGLGLSPFTLAEANNKSDLQGPTVALTNDIFGLIEGHERP